MFLFAALVLPGCGTAPVEEGEYIEPVFPAHRILRRDVTPELELVYDPWEGINRNIYRFNAQFDRFVFLPAVDGYRAITPDFLEQGISNFYSNLTEPTSFINSAMQLKAGSTATALGRFALNSTLGAFGLFDVATFMDIDQQREDFGQTLGHYGVGHGHYLVLPFAGPSNLRDTGGSVFDALTANYLFNKKLDPFNFQDHTEREIAFTVVRALDIRKNVALRYHETGSPFEYELLRRLYTTLREVQIEK